MADTFDWLNPFASIDLNIAARADGIKGWAIAHRESIQPLKQFLDGIIVKVEAALQSVPPLVMLVLIALIAWQAAGRRVAGLGGDLSVGAWLPCPHSLGACDDHAGDRCRLGAGLRHHRAAAWYPCGKE